MTKPESYAVSGLTKKQVRKRIQEGRVNTPPEGTGRTIQEIVYDNLITPFNILIGVLLIAIFFVAPWQDSLFGLVMIANAAIGIYQEIKAKRTLDRLNVLSAPKTTVIRGGRRQSINTEEIVQDDLVEFTPGDQVVIDGQVISSVGLELDESLLTGEPDQVPKLDGDQVLSGSFVVAGSGTVRATRIGAASYAARLAAEAKEFALVRSELRTGIDLMLKGIAWLIAPTLALLMWSQLRTADIRGALRGSIAGIVAMVPQGLVLVTSVAFAVGVIRLGRRRVLVQELMAVEGLARVDVLCVDKTGTLTTGHLSAVDLEMLVVDDVPAALGALGASDPNPNSTLRAVKDAYPEPVGWRVLATVPFSSSRKWSGATFEGHKTWVIGAPDVIASNRPDILERAEQLSRSGYRTVLLSRSNVALTETSLPADLEPAAFVLLLDPPRQDVKRILEYFNSQGVSLKVISGDHPETVAAIASQVGVELSRPPVDARHLPGDPEELAELMQNRSIFGRVSPQQKRDMVRALQSRGHVVAMTGDGVNDVLALKDADIGIAMGSGATATRAASQIVLLESDFATLPHVVAEGRRVIANVERVANLYITKTVYALALAVIVGVANIAFPFLPRHLTFVGTVTIGIPSFFLALSPSARRARTGFLMRVLRFAVPAGALAAAATFIGYRLVLEQPGATIIEARTAATYVLTLIGLFVLAVISRPYNPARRTLLMAMAGLTAFSFISPGLRNFFELSLPDFLEFMATIGIAAMTGAIMFAALRAVEWTLLVPGLLRSRRAERLEARLRRMETDVESWVERTWRQIRELYQRN
ncbi:MAG: HAD-IC family P-type ATPase [Acidimicrobiia bacterium]|nr:HAD-IC family P-type ATPase [Acidimicrobiia bacterium]NNL28504.1 HAD-IC family P-type ATPase [Acidimicrobiia bacterium]